MARMSCLSFLHVGYQGGVPLDFILGYFLDLIKRVLFDSKNTLTLVTRHFLIGYEEKMRGMGTFGRVFFFAL